MADTSIGKAYVQIVPTAKGITNDVENLLSDGVEKGGETAGKSFGTKMLGALGKLGIAAAVAKTFSDSISEGAKLQQSFGGLDTLYGDAADAAKEYAYEAAAMGISANDYAEQAVSFGAALKSAFGGDTEKAVEAANTAIMDMTDNAAKMGTPIESIQNAYQGFAKGQYNMLDNLKLGYGGTKTEMERLLKDAQEISGVEYNIDNLGDVYDAIHVIQKNLGLTGVAADEAKTTFEGSMNAMKAAAANVLGNLALGENIRPSLMALGTSIKTFLVGNALPMIGNIISMIPTLLSEIPGFIGDLLPDLVAGIGNIAVDLAYSFIENIPIFVDSVGQMLSSIWNAVSNIDWSAVGETIVNLLAYGWDTLKATAQTIWDAVVGIFTGEVEFPDLAGLAYTAWNTLITLASTIWEAVKGWFTTTFTWPNISNAAKLVWDKLVEVASTVWENVKSALTKAFKFPSLTQAAQDVWQGLENVASTIWENIKSALTAVFNFPSLTRLAYDAWNGLITLASTIWESIKSWFTSTFKFPSLDEIAKAAWDGLTGIAQGIWDGIKGVFSGWGSDFSLAGITEEQASQAWNTLTTAATNIWDGIKEIFGSFEITWPDFGALAQGALDGLKSAAEGVWNWVKGLFSGDEDNEAVKQVQGSTSEMAAALADAQLQISDVDVTSIQTANEFVKQTVLGWMNIFSGMKNWMVLPTVDTKSLQATSQVISSWISTWKRQMNFIWTLPTPHGYLPSFSVSMHEASSSDGSTKANYPVFSKSLQWFAKGGIFDAPTVIGVGDAPSPEAVVPLDMMWRQMGKELDEHAQSGNNFYFTINESENAERTAHEVAYILKKELRMA